MDIVLTKDMIETLGEKLIPFGVTEDKRRWDRDFKLDLSGLTKTRARQLRDTLDAAGPVKGIKGRIADIDQWLAILGGDTVRCRRLRDFAPMLKQYLKTVPKHWVYEKRTDSDIWQPYYVTDISYTPPQRSRDYGTTPGYVRMKMAWEELGENRTTSKTFYAEDVEGLTAARALAQAGYTIESPEKIAAYLENRRLYILWHDKVGRQLIATGVAEKEAEDDYWWHKSKIHMSRDGVPAHVVVDVLHEGDKEHRSKENHISGQFWDTEGCDFDGKDDDDDDDVKPGEEEETETETAQIPLAPALMCFDLKRHARLKIYTDQMTEYKYQTDLASKLILPSEITDLVDMLVAHRGGFRDIVGNKSGGAIILCAGPPGTGKTLTSEIYSEAMGRPLYSVQCSQLGIKPDDLEEELLKVFARAQRWNAILLLDEADVYVASRGRDLVQNSIVGVFLRVLEYYGGVLFMTTNRADLVDDAVASRCLARIDYAVPTPENQRRIWRTLADTAGIEIADKEIAAIVREYPGISGRDVKNLLKLGSMVAAARGKPITADTIRFVKQFKPTQDPGETDVRVKAD